MTEPNNLSRLGEFEIIDRLRPKFGHNKYVVLPSGDDAAIVDTPDGDVVIGTDMAVEGVHFRTDWSSPIQIGQRIAAQNFADIAAMGAVPVAITVALAVPVDTHITWIEGLMLGIEAESKPLGVAVVGGDLSRSDTKVIAITALGHRRGLPAVTRSEAAVGDVVAVAGRLGYSAAGLACLLRGHRSPREAVDAFQTPTPPYAAGPAAAKAGATAMIDVSDGLIADLGHIATASGVCIDLTAAGVEPDEFLLNLARNMAEDPRLWVLSGGEDHAIVAVFPPKKKLPPMFRPIGVVVAAEEGRPKVTIEGAVPVSTKGNDHFA
jgi:thiamine-monophosphate kinase